MLKNQQNFPRWAARKNEMPADVGQQNLVEPLWLEKKDSNKPQGLVFQDKDENGLELSLGLTYGSSQCKSSDAKRNMIDSQESRNNLKVSKMDGLGASSRSFLEEKCSQQECPRFRDGDSSQACVAHELEVPKFFLAHEHEIHVHTNATAFQDFNKKLLEEKENPLSNERTQPYPIGAEPWSWGKNNGEQEKVRALRKQLQEIQEGLGGAGHASASISKSIATASGKVGPQAGLLPAIDFVSRSRGETGPWSSAQLMDVVHSMDSTVPMLLAGFPSHLKGAAQMFVSQNNTSDERAVNVASSSKGAPVAQLSEILQQHGIPEQHMQREVHLQKQQEARKKRKMLIDEQKQQKKAKEDDRSPLCSGSMGTVFRRPGSSQWPRSWEVQTREQTVPSSLDHNGDPEQLIEAFPSSQVSDQAVKDAGVRTEESHAGFELQEDRVGATMNYIQKLRGEEAATTPLSNCNTMLLPGSNDDTHSNTSVDKLEGADGESAILQKEEASPIVVHIQTQSQCGTMKPGIMATAPSTVKPGSHGSMPPSELKLHHQGSKSDAFTSPSPAVEASQGFPAKVVSIYGSTTKLSVGEGINHEDAASQLARDVEDESTTSGKVHPVEFLGRSGKAENHTSLPSENSNMKGALGIWQLGTTRGIPGMEILSREPYNLQPGIAVGQTFGGTGSSPDLPWVSSSSLNGKAVSGVVYQLIHGPIRIVCACHGKHMTPAEFSKHGASLEFPDKDVSLCMGTFSDGTEATSAKA